MDRKSKLTRRAFTLLELLVVLLIIGVLAALLLPAMGRMRDQAKRVQCINNLRQIGIAFYLYLDEHDEVFPPGGGKHANYIAERDWERHLHPYIDDQGVFVCHAPVTVEMWDTWHGPTGEMRRYTENYYGYNGFLGGADDGGHDVPKRLSQVKRPSRTILCVDARSHHDGGMIFLSGHWGGPDIECWHSNGANILFVGGSAEWFRKDVIEENMDSHMMGHHVRLVGLGEWRMVSVLDYIIYI